MFARFEAERVFMTPPRAPKPPEGSITCDIEKCPRCNGDHRAILFKMFTRKQDGGYTHWATCPNLGEPLVALSGTFITVI